MKICTNTTGTSRTQFSQVNITPRKSGCLWSIVSNLVPRASVTLRYPLGNWVDTLCMETYIAWLTFSPTVFLLGCLIRQTQSRSSFSLFVFFFLVFFFFSVSVKVLPVTPLVSGVFVYRAFWAYFLRIERVVELRRFLWWAQ